MNACLSDFRVVNPTLRTFSAAEARIAQSSIYTHISALVNCHSSFLPFGLKYSKRLTTHGTKSSSRSRTKKKTEVDGNRVTIHDSA